MPTAITDEENMYGGDLIYAGFVLFLDVTVFHDVFVRICRASSASPEVFPINVGISADDYISAFCS